MKHLEIALNNKKGFKTWVITLLKYILAIVVAFVAQAVAMGVLIGLVYTSYFASDGAPDSMAYAFGDPMAMLKSIDSNISLLVLMIPMAISLLVILVMIRLLHKRSFAGVVNGTKKTRWARVLFGFAVWFGFMIVLLLVQLVLSPEELTLQFELNTFLPLLAISLLLIPLQTTFEEVMTRGYLAQGVAALTKSRIAALLIPAMFFALLHISNPEIGEYGMGIMLATYFTMAMILGLTSILDDGIELAIGIHAANNMFISLFTTQQGSAFETAAVFEVAKGNPYIDLLILLAIGAVVIGIFYKKYGWSWNTINIKIEKQQDIDLSVK